MTEDKIKILKDFADRRHIFDKYLSEKKVQLFTCPSCGYPTLTERGAYEICSICYWEDDDQDDPEADKVWGGPNASLSLTDSRLQIGKILEDISAASGRTLNLSPDSAMQAVRVREIKLHSFIEMNLTGDTTADGPEMRGYQDLRRDTLIDLFV